MHSASIRRIAILLVFVCAGASLGLLAACGSSEPQLPHVTTSVGIGPSPHEMTVSVRTSGDGHGVAEFVLTYPDGHEQVGGVGVLEQETSLGWTLKQLPSGPYEYAFYAVPTAAAPMAPDFPSGARTEKNRLSSGTFTID
jgi:hypothetical protein